jgi:hypothetical protein
MALKTKFEHGTEGWIAEARKVFDPTPVRLHHRPKWFMQLLAAAKRRNPHGPAAGFYEDLRRGSWKLDWMDHWGSTVLLNGTPAFVSEPYGITSETLAEVEAIAEECGCYANVSANSYWYPGSTIRIEIYPKPKK